MTQQEPKLTEQPALRALQQSLTAILLDVESGVEDEMSAIRTQVNQIQNLLKDAIASLYESFESLDEHTKEQMQSMSNLMFDIVGQSEEVLDGRNIFECTDEASVSLTEMVARLIDNSEMVLQAANMMDGIKPHMKKLKKASKSSASLLAEMQQLTRIEGEDSAQLLKLIDKLAVQQQEESNELLSVNEQFISASKKVSQSAGSDINDVYAVKEYVEKLLEHLYSINNIISGCRAKVTDVNGVIRQDLGKAIRSLQFEDIVSQSLGHTELHLNRMNTFVQMIAQGVSDLQQQHGDDVEAYQQKLVHLQAEVGNYRQEVRLEESNPVSQQSMDEGDVDLF